MNGELAAASPAQSAARRAWETYVRFPGHFQITTLFTLIVIGMIALEFSITWAEALATIATCVLAELAFTYAQRRILIFPRSALSAAASLCAFFRGDTLWMFVLAALVAIGSKYVIRTRGSHVFNPSNFAIVVLAFLFPSHATIEFTQWGHALPLFPIIAVLCLTVSYFTGTILIAGSFLAAYAVLFLLWFPLAPTVFAPHHYGLIGPTLVIFATFMITDPRTAPQGNRDRVLYTIAIALTYFLLEWSGVRYAIFAALFLVLALVNGIGRLVPLPERLRSLPLIATLCGALALTGFAYVRAGSLPPSGFSDARLSLSYLAFGVESPEFLSCAAHPAFVPAQKSGVTAAGITYGAAWGDYNGDGYDDLFVSMRDQPNRLYRNNGDGTFTDVTAQMGLPLQSSSSAFFADYDNDGKPDLFVAFPSATPLGPEAQLSDAKVPALAVYENTGTKFVDVTARLGLSSLELPESSGSLSFADYNRDGFLDFVFAAQGQSLFLDFSSTAFLKSLFDPYFKTTAEYVCDPARERAILAAHPVSGSNRSAVTAFLAEPGGCMLAYHSLPLLSNASASGNIIGAILYRPGSLHLFKNSGGARYAEVPQFAAQAAASVAAKNAGDMVREGTPQFADVSGRFFQPISFDASGDGLDDIFVSTDFGRSVFFKNLGGFRFAEEGTTTGFSYAGTNMGVAVADTRRSGNLDLFTSNMLRDYLYENRGGSFALSAQNLAPLGIGWGASFLDYDLDGWPDLFVTNGDVQKTYQFPIPSLSRSLFRLDAIYRNEGGGVFADTSGQALCPSDESGKALAVADYNNDGAPDVFVGTIVYGPLLPGSGNLLYEDTARAKNGNHYLEIRLRGTRDNSMGVGARVSVTSPLGTQEQELTLGGSFYSENSQTLLFGLGSSTAPVSVTVRWPSGAVTNRTGIPVDERIDIRE